MAQIPASQPTCNGRELHNAWFLSHLNGWRSKLSTVGGDTRFEQMAQIIDASMTWKDCHVECASQFHTWVQKHLHDHILSGGPYAWLCLGRHPSIWNIFHGLLHTHIILWIEHSNLGWIANEINAIVLAMFDTTLKKFVEPINPHQDVLFKAPMEKYIYMKKKKKICTLCCHYGKHRHETWQFPYTLERGRIKLVM